MTLQTDSTADRRLELMGTTIRILVGPVARAGLPSPDAAAERVETFLRGYDQTMSRFRPDSELCALNADPREVVPVSAQMRSAISAALVAAERSGGLVDPTVYDALMAVGYDRSWDRSRRIGLAIALAKAQEPRRAARPRSTSRWREIVVDDVAGTISRPPGLHLDTGGTGKGHAADLAGALLDGYTHWAVDCGGDVRMGGAAGFKRRVDVEHPFTGEATESFVVRDGAVATSGLSSRIWTGDDDTVRHHLLDPSTGQSCFTGLVAVTAVAPTGVAAETLAKTALLSGPLAGRRALSRYGGAMVDERGCVERIEAPAERTVVRFRVTDRRLV